MKTPSRKNEAIWSEERQHWRLDVQVNGKRKSFYSTLKGRKGRIECGQKADEWIEDHGDSAGANPRFGELWEQYLTEVKSTTGSGNYINLESIGRVYLLPALRAKHVADITLQDWQNRITVAYKKGRAKKTCSNIRGAITSLYRYARKNRVNMERPDLLTIPRNAPVGERHILQPDQIRTLFSIDWINDHGTKTPCWCIHIWRFDVLAGLRRGELAGLRWTDLKDSILHIERAINSQLEETRGKNDNARRYIALAPRMKAVLDDQKAMLKRSGIVSPWIFPATDGGRINPDKIYKDWRTYRSQHDISSSIHEIRHTMISLVSPEVPDALLKPIVGHSKAMDTDIYRHRVEGNAERAAALIDEVFSRVLKK